MTWKRMKLNELGFVGRGKSKHRPRDAAHLYGGPYPFVQTADVKHANFNLSSFTQTYSEAGLAQSKLWQAGTLCITIAANIADTAILGMDACFPDSIIGFVADKEKCDVKFIKYQFDVMQQLFQRFSQGSAQDNLSMGKLVSLDFVVPPLSIQRKIASILSAYDDLIENNLRRIALLEEAARLLYQEWFVRLRFPSFEHVRIVDGVPKGWGQVTVEDVLTLQRGFDLPSQSRRAGLVPIVASTGINGFHDKAMVKGPGVVTGRSGSLGNVHYICQDFWPLNTTLWVKEFKRVRPIFAYFLLKELCLEKYNGGVSVVAAKLKGPEADGVA